MQTPPAHALPPRKVPASHGWQWLRQAFFLVREQPLTWVLFAVCYLLLQSLLGSLGSIGPLLNLLTVPVFAGGFVLAAARADRGETLRPQDVFDACRSHVRQLLGLGLAYCGLLVAAMLLMAMALLALAGGNLEGDALTAMPLGKQIVGLALLGGGVFMTSLLYWFAPAAVVLGSFDPLRAMRRSLAGGWINLSAVLLCGVILAILLFLAMLPFGLGLLLWLPVMFVSVYVAWQDVFGSGLPQRG
ncbi:MAG: BPSS1780 family membrane protein [Vogesella sp.]|uniref:BPSS1780 family membrane protein n=1 Tax=Vogesella sp. TaxID=1904252 RepID=UPI00391B319B